MIMGLTVLKIYGRLVLYEIQQIKLYGYWNYLDFGWCIYSKRSVIDYAAYVCDAGMCNNYNSVFI